MDLNDIKAVYFIGIGGIGMSAIARFFLSREIPVGGYDHTPSVLTERLKAEGAHIIYDDDPDEISATFKNSRNTLVVYTPAILQTTRCWGISIIWRLMLRSVPRC